MELVADRGEREVGAVGGHRAVWGVVEFLSGASRYRVGFFVGFVCRVFLCLCHL